MKNSIISLWAILLLFSSTAMAQSTSQVVQKQKHSLFEGSIKFDHQRNDFGVVLLNHPVTVTYTFTNISKKPVTIRKVRSACSCITSTWTTRPVLPQKKGLIKVTYNAASISEIHQSVDVAFKGFPKALKLYISGKVKKQK